VAEDGEPAALDCGGRQRLERQGVEISGPGGIQQTFNFMAEQTAGAPMVAVTLKNGIATYS
jgi:hypothetical protein